MWTAAVGRQGVPLYFEEHAADVVAGSTGDGAETGGDIHHVKNAQEGEDERLFEFYGNGVRDHQLATGRLLHTRLRNSLF